MIDENDQEDTEVCEECGLEVAEGDLDDEDEDD